MVWIKRNLFFVISIAVGLLLTGYCGYLLYSSVAANSGVSEDYKSKLGELQDLQKKSPFPSTENIQAAKADQENVRKFLTEFRKRFASFPPPPAKDQKGFKAYLEDSLLRFRTEGTNAGVLLPADYSFSFSGLLGKLTYPPANIAQWMQQMEEINAILDILYHAKINYLGGVQRAPVAPDDSGSGDCLPTPIVTNQWGIVSPYKITFRGFSAEVAAVMDGFARSSNCFIIQAIGVEPDKSLPPPPAPTPAQQPAVVYSQPRYPTPGMNPPGTRPRAPGGPSAASITPGSVAAVSSPPVTVLSEGPLSVTISVNVVKLKASDH